MRALCDEKSFFSPLFTANLTLFFDKTSTRDVLDNSLIARQSMGVSLIRRSVGSTEVAPKIWVAQIFDHMALWSRIIWSEIATIAQRSHYLLDHLKFRSKVISVWHGLISGPGVEVL